MQIDKREGKCKIEKPTQKITGILSDFTNR